MGRNVTISKLFTPIVDTRPLTSAAIVNIQGPLHWPGTPIILPLVFAICCFLVGRAKRHNDRRNAAVFTAGSTPGGDVDTIYSEQSHQPGAAVNLIWPLFVEICVCLQISFLFSDLGSKHQ